MRRELFYAFLLLYLFAIGYLAITLPIGPNEAKVYYTDSGVLYALSHFAKGWFSNGLDFRLPFFLSATVNIVLFLMVSQIYFSKKEESYLSTAIFMLLPGIITSAIVVNIAVVVITLVLLFILFYVKRQLTLQTITILLLLVIHDASIIFFTALAIFSWVKKEHYLLILSLGAFLLSLIFFNGLDIGGKPKGDFLALFGLYMALFSPLVFLYFFYALYRIWLREEKDILWYISFTAFILSLILSLRQEVKITDFAPYVIVSVLLMIVVFQKTLQVRLPQFQKGYRFGFYLLIGSLVTSASILFFHKSFFYLLDDKSKHFAYRFYEPYWQVEELHEIGQDCYTVTSKKVQYQLKYYGIEECKESYVPKIHR